MRYLHRFPMQPLRGLPGMAGSPPSPTSRINGVQIPVVIGADLRAMADWLPPQAQRISDISCVGLALDGSSDLTRHSFAKIVESQPTLEDLSHPARHWDEQGVQSTNQRMEGWRSISCWCGSTSQHGSPLARPSRCQAARASRLAERTTKTR